MKKNILTSANELIDKITMYKLMIFGLLSILLFALLFSILGIIHYSALSILLSVLIVFVVSYIANKAFAALFDVHTNFESWIITSYIIVLIFPPVTNIHAGSLIALASLIAIASKFLITYRHKQLVNPVVAAAVILGVSGLLPAIWWVGSPSLAIPVVLFGLLLLRKLRRFRLFVLFVVGALLISTILIVTSHQAPGVFFSSLFLSGPILFFGTIMLTEPQTMPPKQWHQNVYGFGVGIIYASQFNLGFVSATPEIALLIGNIFSFVVGAKFRLQLPLISKKKLSSSIYEYTFTLPKKIRFLPGQYMEWTLPFEKTTDFRGNRRSFSIASAPNESHVSFVVRNPEPGSWFKQALLDLEEGGTVATGHPTGHFILPRDAKQKVVLMAGGIGITPFLSMVRDLIARKLERDIVLFYFISKQEEYLFQEVWKIAKACGLTVIPVLSDMSDTSWTGTRGPITNELIAELVPDIHERIAYISGPPAFVAHYKAQLKSRSAKAQKVVTDYFSGY